jgi:hypothetical protein
VSFLVDGTLVDKAAILNIDRTSWMHLAVDLVPVDGGATFSTTATANGMTVTQAHPVFFPGAFGKLQLQVGSEAATGSFRVELDNVVVAR